MPALSIDAEIAAVLAGVPPTVPPLNDGNLAAAREQLGQGIGVVLSDQVRREDRTVPGSPAAPDVILRIHTPLTAGPEPVPCVYSIHGGGYVLGSRALDDLKFDRLCPKLNFIAVSVEYRLAPETPYPGPLEDCFAGLQWVYANAGELGIDRGRIGITGSSAGGGLAAALTLLARDHGGAVRPAFQLLTYPMLDDRQTTPSSQWEVPVWSPSNNLFGWRSYLGPLYGSGDVPYHAAPARAEDLAGLPKTLIYVGTRDGFCDEDIQYAMRLNQAGVETEMHLYPGAPHGFENIAPTARISQRCMRDTEEWLIAALQAAG